MSPPGRRTRLQGAAVLVTGASRGIGFELARLLAAEGCRLALLARSAAGLERAAREIAPEAPPDSLIRLPADVSEAPAVERAVARIAETFGRLDLAVHCAGILETGRWDEIPVESYRRVMEVNYLGAVHVARACLPRLEASGGGRLVLLASIISARSYPGFAAYAPSKWALGGLHETLLAETKGARSAVSLAFPPITDTPMVRELPPDRRPAVYDVFAACPPDRVARGILRGIVRGRRRIFVRVQDRFYFTACRLAPGLTGRLLDAYIGRRRSRS